VVVDSVPGGSKLLAQMRRLEWPLAFDVADLDSRALRSALEYALTEEARELARQTAARAVRDVAEVRDEFLGAVGARSIDP